MNLHIRYIKLGKKTYSLQYKKRNKWKDFSVLHGCYGSAVWIIFTGKSKECLEEYLDFVNVRNVKVYEHPTIKVLNP